MSTINQADTQQAAAFLCRMIPFSTSGMSFEDAGKAVLARDKELMSVATSNTEEGAFIRKQMAAEVYSAVRGK